MNLESSDENKLNMLDQLLELENLKANIESHITAEVNSSNNFDFQICTIS